MEHVEFVRCQQRGAATRYQVVRVYDHAVRFQPAR
jgi:hypothetical protein